MAESYFVLKFRLKTEKWQEDMMDKRFEAGRKLYNSLVSKSLKVLRELEKTKTYRNAYEKKDWKTVDKLRKEAGLTEYGLIKMMTPLRYAFKEHINVHIAQQLANRIWSAYEKYFYKGGKTVRFKKYGSLTSLAGKTNTNAIIFKKDAFVCKWSSLILPIVIDTNNSYEIEALEMPIAYNIIYREWIRGKKRYYIYIIFKGVRPAKRRKSDGSFSQKLGKGEVGIDIGTSTVAISSENQVNIFELANKAQGYEREKILLQRKLERSRRSNNKEVFNTDGTINKGSKFLVKSNRYIKTMLQLREIYRKQKVIRKLQHEILSNYILALGDKFFVEKMDFIKLQSKKKEINGKLKSKKQFGYSIANRAPATLLAILDRKLHYFGKELIKIDTIEAKASQFNHITQTYKKKPLSQRWAIVDGHKVQRDMYSAFLIMNVNEDLKSFNLEKCNERFNNFLELHDKEAQRLKGQKNLRSIGI